MTLNDLICRLDPADVSTFTADDYIDVRFRLYSDDFTAVCISVAFMSIAEPTAEEWGPRLVASD